MEGHRILLFMKGDRDNPRCGFSARALAIVNALGQPFHTVDVLADPELRSGMKEFSNWPTFPQLYLDGELIGGSDILTELWENGELQQLVAG